MTSSNPSRTMSGCSSVYFRSSGPSRAVSSSPSPDGQEIRKSDTSSNYYARYASSSRLGTPHAPTVPPSTIASGRRSRATTTASILGHTDSKSVICALSESRGVSPSVGLAIINVSIGEVILSQICDVQTYVKTIHKIQMSGPSRILIMSSTLPPNKPSDMSSLVQELVPEARILGLDRSSWSETAGLEYIQKLALVNDIEPLKVALNGKFYAVSSLSAVMKYVEQHFAIKFSPHSLRIRYQPSEDTMMIDISAIQSLEVMQNIRNPKSKDCLFGLLNNTSTPMGSRMLRSNILQPPTRHWLFIIPRYDAVEELTINEEIFHKVHKVLKLFTDVEKLLTKLITHSTTVGIQQVESQINQVLMIKNFLEAVPELFAALEPATSALLIKSRDFCRPEISGRILRAICKTIEPDVKYLNSPLDLRNQRAFAVKSGICGILDVARQTYKELTEEIYEHIGQVNVAHKVEATLRFDNGRKYWLRINAAEFDGCHIPDTFINVVKKKDKIECQTLNLVKLNMRLYDTSNEIIIRSDAIVQALVEEIRLETPHLFQVCESVALVDMICSFAKLSITHDYIRPEITNTLALRSARHPVLDKTMVGEFVPNDYYATERYCFHAVTGCNMSGKSTYIRAIALLQIMAQIGSFVPARYASFSIVRCIFARVSMEDSIEKNLSSFSVEMREMAFILRNIDDKCLAIIDELGRGTSSRDGLAISCAMAEALIQSKASVWFATHFTELARALAGRPGVLNLHLAVDLSVTDEGLSQTTMLYKATNGTLDDSSFYGINLARAMGLPQAFIKKAEEVAHDLRRKREANRQSSESKKLQQRRRLVLNLYDALQMAKDSNNETSLSGYLSSLKEEFIEKMKDIDEM